MFKHPQWFDYDLCLTDSTRALLFVFNVKFMFYFLIRLFGVFNTLYLRSMLSQCFVNPYICMKSYLSDAMQVLFSSFPFFFQYFVLHAPTNHLDHELFNHFCNIETLLVLKLFLVYNNVSQQTDEHMHSPIIRSYQCINIIIAEVFLEVCLKVQIQY